jgi:hypothetical protein
VKQEIDEELRFHIDQRTAENVAAGMSAEDAAREARKRFGNFQTAREQCREVRGASFGETVLQDVRFGLRMMFKNPGFTMVAVLTLALGIGANTAIFTIVNDVLLNPLPYPHPDQLVALRASKPNFEAGSISYPNFRDWQKQNQTFTAMAISRGLDFILTGAGEPERVRAQLISSDFFAVLGVKPAPGRNLLPGEDEIGGSPLVLISASFWQRKFNSAPDVPGKSLTLDDKSYTIVGVIPANFKPPLMSLNGVEVYIPIGQWQNPSLPRRAAGLGISGIGRLKPGTTIEEMGGILDRGRFFTDQDNQHAPAVAVVDEVFAGKFFASEDAIGKRLNVDGELVQIVGVVRHMKQWGLQADDQQGLRAEVFKPFWQGDDDDMGRLADAVDVMVRAQGDTSAVFESIRSVLQSRRSEDVVFAPRTMNEIVAGTVAAQQFLKILLEAFAVVALLLGGIGLYGVVSCLVGQRTQEFGIRLALGAQRHDLLRLVLTQGVRMAFTGIAAGWIAAFVLTRLMTKMLFGVSATDPLTYGAISVLLGAATLLSCWLPARRAARVDPMVALRHE